MRLWRGRDSLVIESVWGVADAVDAGGAGNAAEGCCRAGGGARSRTGEVAGGLDEPEEVLRLRTIGPERYLEALAEEEQPAGTVVGPSPGKPVGPRCAVPHRQNPAGPDDLSVDCQAVMAAAAEAGGDGPGARRAAVVLGWDRASASRVEGARARLKGLRARLKGLVERGWLVEAMPGRFTLPAEQRTDEAVRPGGGS
ncbi:hypothetical protein SRO_0225 [Streptomyces rochei]|nr:hypothetical protein SRO_0225 [Streptomyces rochei]